MPEIKVLKADTGGKTAEIRQLPVSRDWMDATNDKHAYHCFPMSLTNRMGWGISFPEDITFIWDGVFDSSNEHVKILSGESYCSANRGNATISFNTGLHFRTDENTTTLVMPVPNQFIDGIQCFTALISTSFLTSALPIAWRITRPNIEITIPAGTPVASVIPISLTNLETYELLVEDANFTQEDWQLMSDYGNSIHQYNLRGEWSNFYKNATNHGHKKIGNHEIRNINLKTTDKTQDARN
jgi:hypothetical protein